ncbi:MAG: hypothetical protein ACLR3R_19485 [Clostridium paraputrificum]
MNIYFCIVLLFMCYLVMVDYVYHEFPLRFIVLLYPVIICTNIHLGASWFETIFGFLILFVPMYVCQLFSREMVYGGLDIVSAPLFTIWFGVNGIYYSLLFIVIYSICHLKVITEFLKKGKQDCLGRPLIPIMYFTFLVSLCLIDSYII